MVFRDIQGWTNRFRSGILGQLSRIMCLQFIKKEFDLHLDPSDQIDPKFLGNGRKCESFSLHFTQNLVSSSNG